MSRISKGFAGAASATMVLAAGVLGGGVASAATINAKATITNVATNAPLLSGVGTTTWTVVLPPVAKCSGDSAHDGYHVYSYVVSAPVPDTAAKIIKEVKAINPVNVPSTTVFPLTEQNGNFYEAANTAIGTGQIVQIPLDFQWSALNTVLVGGGLKPLYGTKSKVDEIGIFCANSNTNKVTDFWNQEVTFTKKASAGGGFTWKAKA